MIRESSGGLSYVRKWLCDARGHRDLQHALVVKEESREVGLPLIFTCTAAILVPILVLETVRQR